MRTANDVLPALFISETPAEVIAAAAALPRLSSGQIRHGETFNRRTGKPERGGLFCAKVFGPVEDHRCLCGKLSGPAHAGVTCDRCGVLCGEKRLRGERWGHIELPVPLVHPVLVPSIAHSLGCTPQDVRDIVAFRKTLHADGRITAVDPEVYDAHGSADIAARLGESELLLTRVPVLPAEWRGTRRDPQDVAYTALINRVNRSARLIELSAPMIILDNELRMTQEALEKLIVAVRREHGARRPLVVAPSTSRAAALLQAVYDHPASDAARHAYAEHLTRAGDLRGEFITLQLASAARRPAGVHRMTRQEDDLLRRNFDRWIAPLAGAIDERVAFRRGFPAMCRTVPAAAGRLDEPAWATIEHLDSELPELIVHPTLRALERLGTSWAALRAVCERDTSLPQIHTLTVRLPRAPAGPEVFTRGEALPGLRDLTLFQGSGRAAGFEWLDDTPIARQLDRLTLLLPLDRLPSLDLPWWTGFLGRQPGIDRLTLALDRRNLLFELRRDNHWCTLRVVIPPVMLERVMLGYTELAQQLTAALTALAPQDVFSVRVESRSRWWGDELEAVHRALRDHFGGSVTLPALA